MCLHDRSEVDQEQIYVVTEACVHPLHSRLTLVPQRSRDTTPCALRSTTLIQNHEVAVSALPCLLQTLIQYT